MLSSIFGVNLAITATMNHRGGSGMMWGCTSTKGVNIINLLVGMLKMADKIIPRLQVFVLAL